VHSNHTDEGAASVSAPEEVDPIAAAHALIANELQQRKERCVAEIEQVLAKYGMRLHVPMPQITIVPAE
jgi:hypothetical protein